MSEGDVRLVYTDAFADAYRDVSSRKARERIRRAVEAIATFPDMGMVTPRKSLVKRYGPGIRTMPAGSYAVVYEHHENEVALVALVPGRLVL